MWVYPDMIDSSWEANAVSDAFMQPLRLHENKANAVEALVSVPIRSHLTFSRIVVYTHMRS